jgi:pimeloyl-ACP methyl ester carboxylesterase
MRKDARDDMITTKDGPQISYKDWSSVRPVVFSHGWPLSPSITTYHRTAAIACSLGNGVSLR